MQFPSPLKQVCSCKVFKVRLFRDVLRRRLFQHNRPRSGRLHWPKKMSVPPEAAMPLLGSRIDLDYSGRWVEGGRSGRFDGGRVETVDTWFTCGSPLILGLGSAGQAVRAEPINRHRLIDQLRRAGTAPQCRQIAGQILQTIARAALHQIEPVIQHAGV